MDAKEAIARAKSYVMDLYADEHVSQLGLEEVEHDSFQQNWIVTLVLSRPWDAPRTRAQEVLESLGAASSLRRSYKVVRLSEDGNVISMKNPEGSIVAR